MSTSDASLGCFAGGFCGEIGGEVPGDREVDVGVGGEVSGVGQEVFSGDGDTLTLTGME